jgi:hypothetical protein
MWQFIVLQPVYVCSTFLHYFLVIIDTLIQNKKYGISTETWAKAVNNHLEKNKHNGK